MPKRAAAAKSSGPEPARPKPARKHLGLNVVVKHVALHNLVLNTSPDAKSKTAGKISKDTILIQQV
jgi:hypothetical protein